MGPHEFETWQRTYIVVARARRVQGTSSTLVEAPVGIVADAALAPPQGSGCATLVSETHCEVDDPACH
jgi:hypothetical protein